MAEGRYVYAGMHMMRKGVWLVEQMEGGACSGVQIGGSVEARE